MKTFRLAAVVVVFAIALVRADPAEASRVFLSTTSTNPAFINPVTTVGPGGTAALHLFWQPTLEQVGTDPYSGDPVFQNEQLSGFSHDIVSSTPIASRTSYTIANPTVFGTPRWGSTNSGGGTPTFVVDNANAVKVGGSNLGFGTTGQDSTYQANGTWRLATLVLQQTAEGTTDLRLGVGGAGISFQSTPNAREIHFGFGDAAVQSNSFGSTSTLADAMFIYVPEPASLVFAALGVLGIGAVAHGRRR